MAENKLSYFGLYLGLTLFFYVSSVNGSALIPGQGPYQPNWESLDSRPLPKWYDEAKIGIFIHWGVFSTPSFGSEWFWWYFNGEKRPEYIDFMNKNYRPGTTYQDLAKDFTAEFYNPDQWAEIFQASGAKYVVLTTKHHEGFTLWPSVNSFSWNAMDLGPKRDLVGALADSIRNKTSLHFGIYHSLFEWFNPIYIRDRESNFTKQDFIRRKTMPELYELVERYKPEVIWSDGEGEAPSKYWNSTHFLTWLYNESPVKDVVVTNDRWGNDTPCKHGGFYSCQDRFNPGKKQNHKWENAMTIDKNSWGFRRNAALKDYLNIEDLITLLAQTVSCGGNLLINVGPTKDGRIEPIFEERLRQLGQWLKVNGEAIYSTEPWSYQNDTITAGVWYTSKSITSNKVGDDKVVVYAIILSWPKGSNVALGALNNIDPATNIQLLGYPSEKSLPWKKGSLGETIVALPILTPDVLPCNWAWVLKITND